MTQRANASGRTGGGAAPRRRPPADRRIAERRKAIVAARVRRRRRILGWALAAIALAAGVAWLIRTPLFGLSAVRVDGTQAVARAEVLEASKVRIGEPYLGLDLAAIRDRVAALPRVAAVRVTRDYPSSLRIAVTERPPVASVSTGSVYWLVAADGTVLDAAGRRPADLPYVARVPLPDGVARRQPPAPRERAGQRPHRPRRHGAPAQAPGGRRQRPDPGQPRIHAQGRLDRALRARGGPAGKGRRRVADTADAEERGKGGAANRRPESVGTDGSGDASE